MDQPIYNFDEASDTLYISFCPGEKTTGIELTPLILLRVNKQDRKSIGITLFEYSLLAQKTEIGPRSFQLSRDLDILTIFFIVPHWVFFFSAGVTDSTSSLIQSKRTSRLGPE